MSMTTAERVRNYRARRKETGGEDTSRRNSSLHYRKWYKKNVQEARASLPFIGCDGEGAGKDELGRQQYMLFRMGERELFTGEPLTTYELLDFICREPAGTILVGFAFGYDVTMILRDLSTERQQRLLAPRIFGQGKSPYTWWREFNIDYLPRQFLRVQRCETFFDEFGNERRRAIPGSTRTIWETFGFFQKSFVKCLRDFKVAPDPVLEDIASTKDKRGGDDWHIGDHERHYCALECDMLALLMTRLRSYCTEADIYPKSWSGAGKLAEALHGKHETMRAPKDETQRTWPREVEDYANRAYYGGRFEITTVGKIEGTVYEYDICSAYPSAMRGLPCLRHGGWRFEQSTGALPKAELYVAHVSFSKRGELAPYIGSLGGLPVRLKTGHLCWPLASAGHYWSDEIRSAVALGHKVKCHGAWVYEPKCECELFDWVEPLYDYRKSIGSQGPGYPIKLGINSLYGKLAQRRGHGVYCNMIWAGLITARTRALLNQAIALDPNNIVMIATDAVYSRRPLALPIGERLGQWECSELPGLFVVQPGLYWSPGLAKKKSRGLSGKFFEEKGRIEGFQNQWADWLASQNSGLDLDFPSVAVDFEAFIGMKLALARGKPETAGQWVATERKISFDYRRKRNRHIINSGAILTGAIPKAPPSVAHRDFIEAGGAEPWENARLELADQPDYIDLGPPWRD